MSFIFGEIPEEFQAAIDRQHMEQQVTRNEIDRFIETLPVDDLMTLRTIVRTASMSAAGLGFFDGVIYSRLRSEGRCTACGGPDHDHEALEQALASESDSDDDEIPGQMLIPGTEFTEDQHRLMAEYNLDDVREEGTNKLLGFVCLGCGLMYQSVEDRMLRPVEGGCHGCQHKSAHG